jgi:hypothetical protein
MSGNRPERGRIRLTIMQRRVSAVAGRSKIAGPRGRYWRMLMGLTMSAVSVNTVRPPNSKITR